MGGVCKREDELLEGQGIGRAQPPTLSFPWSKSSLVVVQLLSCSQLFVTPWTAAHQAFLSFTISRNLLRLMSIESTMPSNHLVLCRPLLLPSIRISITDTKYYFYLKGIYVVINHNEKEYEKQCIYMYN